MQGNQGEEEIKFKAMLNQFLKARNLEDRQMNGINQFSLYKLVCRRGGCQSVTNHQQWQNIAQELGGKSPKIVKNHYLKYLYGYQRKNYFGCEQEDNQPIISISLPRKIPKTQSKQPRPKIQENQTLYNQIFKTFQELSHPQSQFHLHKNKLNQTKFETKRILLGLQPFASPNIQTYSLNMLLLYSANPQFPFFLENNEKLFQALSSYSFSMYPPSSEYEKQCLRTVIAIFRNFTMYSTNLKYILGTPIFDLFVKIFNTRMDQECSRNIIDIMTGLVKVGYNCGSIISELQDYLFDDKFDQIQSGIELLRSLVQERDDGVLVEIRERIDAFIRILSSEVSVQVKEQILQILASISDINIDARLAFSKNTKLLGILIGILQHMRNQEKLSQFAALTLSNISTAPGAREYLNYFESQLIQIGFTDDSLAGIIANILADVANV